MGLTANEACRLFRYDFNTGELFWRVDRRANKVADKEAGCVHLGNFPRKYRHVKINERSYFVHRLIWLMIFGYWPKEIDHIDGNGLNNKLSNLREVTRQENLQNARLSKVNTSGVTGVYWNKQCQKWQAGIVIDGRFLYLGRFFNFETAVITRKEAERKYGFHPNHGRPQLRRFADA